MENAWVARLNVAVEAIVGRVEHFEEGMGGTINKIREELASLRTQSAISPAYQPYSTGLGTTFLKSPGRRPYPNNTLAHAIWDPPPPSKGEDQPQAQTERMEGVEYSNIKQVGQTQDNPIHPTHSPGSAAQAPMAAPAVPIIDLTTLKSTADSESAGMPDIAQEATKVDMVIADTEQWQARTTQIPTAPTLRSRDMEYQHQYEENANGTQEEETGTKGTFAGQDTRDAPSGNDAHSSTGAQTPTQAQTPAQIPTHTLVPTASPPLRTTAKAATEKRAP
ncbi:hypothetical protein BDZ91DRAFT_794769 [Kalaharituber pfeilii]|nr:hypothetical protein BDZ91DRAFT_794769 [Kalaharituber pfeilii]